MRKIGSLQPTANSPVPPDTVVTFALVASTPQAQDWLSSGSTVVANAAAAGVGLVRVTGVSSAGAAMLITANLMSTAANVPSSSLSSGGSTAANVLIASPTFFQIPGGSTGYSVASPTSGYVMVEQWAK